MYRIVCSCVCKYICLQGYKCVQVCMCVYMGVCVYKVDMGICWSVCLGHRGYTDVCPEIYVCGPGYAGIYV